MPELPSSRSRGRGRARDPGQVGLLGYLNAGRHLLTGGLALITSPRSLWAAGSSLLEARRFDQYQRTYDRFRQQRHDNPTPPPRPAHETLRDIRERPIHDADRIKAGGQGKTALTLDGTTNHLHITRHKGRTRVETNTMLMMESPAFERAGDMVSSRIKHQEIVMKRKVANWRSSSAKGATDPFVKRGETTTYWVLGGTDEPRRLSNEEWGAYKAQFEKIGRVRVSRDQADQIFARHERRRAEKLETQAGQVKLFGHSIRFLTEYTRLNVCQTHMRDTLDAVFGEAQTDRFTQTFGFSTQGRRRIG